MDGEITTTGDQVYFFNHVLDQLKALRIVPVVAIDKAADAEPLAQALMEGGLPCAEITFRTDAAVASITAIAKAYSDFLVGAGTVLSVDQAASAIDAGASFIVSPGLHVKVVEYCLKEDVPVFPGVMTPTEIGYALDLGLRVVKFFPAEPAGGVPFLRALGGPFKAVSFIPTGGINQENFGAYLSLSNVVACGGSWMVPQKTIAAGNFDVIRESTRSAVQSAKRLDSESSQKRAGK